MSLDANIPYATNIDTPSEGNIHFRIWTDRDSRIISEGFVWGDVLRFRRYYEGKHHILLTDRQKEILRNLNYRDFCDNVCGQVVSEAKGRLHFDKWTCKNQAVSDWLATVYTNRSLDAFQNDVHLRTLRDGNFAVSVNWNEEDEFPELFLEDWWDGTKGVYIHYNSSQQPEYAVKQWNYINTNRVTVFRRLIWFADRIERYESTSPNSFSSWIQCPLDTDIVDGQKVWPMPWIDSDGKPLGIPFIHFKNSYKTYGMYGVSELDGGVIGFQDHLNDGMINMTITSRMTGAQQYWGSGIKLRTRDNSREPMPIKVDAGMFHTSENPDSKFGVLPAGNMDQQISGYLLKIKRVAQITATPLHAITGGDWPSGDAILRAELPAVNKAKTQISSLKMMWCEVGKIALKIWNTFCDDSEQVTYKLKDGIIEATFSDPENFDIVSRSIVVHNVVGQVSKKEQMRILGYSDEQVETIYEEMQEEQKDETNAMAAAMVRGVGTGVGSGNTPPKNKPNKPGNGGPVGGGNNKPTRNAQ
jgi:hypothetical protein